MADIVDKEEVDRDTVSSEELEKLFSKKYKLLTETAVSLKKSYINKLHGTKSLKLAVSLSDNSIEVYELNNTSLNKVCKLSGHKNELKEVVFCPKEDHLLYSTGYDGAIKLWDTRNSGSCAQEYKDSESQIQKQFECMDVCVSGRVLCAGSLLAREDAYLVFWDNRSHKPMGGYWNSHTDDITQVKFHKSKTEILASGSLDGLLNIYNILEGSEEEALTFSLNTGAAPERVAWLDAARVAVSAPHAAQLWDATTGDLLHDYHRDQIARAIKRSKEDDCYVVDAFMCGDAPVLLAGSHAGNGEVLRSVSMCDKLRPRSVLAPNNQLVRCAWYEQHNDVLVTAGESGLISVWRGGEGGPGGEGGGGAKKLAGALNKLHVNRHKPY